MLLELEIHLNQEIDTAQLVDQLREMGYAPVDYVYLPGQYALRGSIIDIFSFAQEQPFRIDRFGDEVETIRQFDVDSQLSTDKLTVCTIYDQQMATADGARAGRIALAMKELQDMKVGDYIVHMDFGVGRFGGLVRKKQVGPDGEERFVEEIRITYQHGDIVDLSILSIYKIAKYRSGEGTPPNLATLGKAAWQRMKERTKTRIKDIARDLIKLYAKRKAMEGFAFAKDNDLQALLEQSFPYEDTPDQERATIEVKTDMELPQPMDRLICGDVGFGKTEVAIRAAFKAACSSKQVAVLVPTTILALQHYKTFSDRLKDMPVRVEYLSRARTAKQTKEILADLKEGKIDILIGTHKLTGKTVEWHDLGLLVIDEEQKFGVAVKERLRKLRANVDTLTLTATPIPRTLQFSLLGARDMSVMRTPPPNRHRIQTTVETFSKDLLREAIKREMSRGGQSFVVTDRVAKLAELEYLIKVELPTCRVVVAHGQMPPADMEKRIIAFINGEYDVLLATTIVENGVDIPNANTIIINNAHHFGLSDLHQMRGRVGRADRKAYCYLVIPPTAPLTHDAQRRLEALEAFAELGSGFALAMQDLDIRGAGNLLGAEQSGFMEEMGYEMYQKILQQAVRELKEESISQATHRPNALAQLPATPLAECLVESDIPMYFSDLYVPTSAERMTLYRQLDNIQSARELEQFRQRLVDRFGKLPAEAEELLRLIPLRELGKRLGCERLTLRQGMMSMQFVSNPDSDYYQSATFGSILNFVASNPRRCQLRENNGKRLMRVASITSLSQAIDLLKTIDNVQ